MVCLPDINQDIAPNGYKTTYWMRTTGQRRGGQLSVTEVGQFRTVGDIAKECE